MEELPTEPSESPVSTVVSGFPLVRPEPLRLALEPECLENRRPPPERNPEMERTRSETLKLFVVSGIERRSLLLSSTRSMQLRGPFLPRSDAPSPAACPWLAGRRRTLGTGQASLRRSIRGLNQNHNHDLKNLFKGAAVRQSLLHLLQLPVDMAVVGAAARLDRKTTDTPQLPLGAKTVRCLQNAKRHRRADRADRGNSAQTFPTSLRCVWESGGQIVNCQHLPLLDGQPGRLSANRK